MEVAPTPRISGTGDALPATYLLMHDPLPSRPATTSPQLEALARHVPWLLGWFGRRVGRDAAEDLTQEALLIALRNHDRVRRPDHLGAYLLGIARHLTRQQLRARREPEEPPIDPVAPPERDPPDRAVTAAVQALPDELAQVVHAYYAEQRTYEEVAALLGLSRATVQSRLRRALVQLRHTLTRASHP